MAPRHDSLAGSNPESLMPLILLGKPGTVRLQPVQRDSRNAEQ